MLRALRDFVAGFRTLRPAGPCVTVFGSARCGDGHPYYALARDVGRRLTRAGFAVMTGGGPGLMEGANRGAREAGGRSVGCGVQLPAEQSSNAYLDRSVVCRHFFVRKVLLFKYSYGFVVLPGGMGTLDELFEALTLIQTGKIERFPIVLIGVEYWAPVLALLQRMAESGMIDAGDLELVKTTDDVEEAVRHLVGHAAARFGVPAPQTPSLAGQLAAS